MHTTVKRLISSLLCAALALCSTCAFASGSVIFGAAQGDFSNAPRFMAYTDGTAYIFPMNMRGFLAVTDAGETAEYAWAEDTIVTAGDDMLKDQVAVAHDGKLYVLAIRVRHNIEENTERVRGAFLYEAELDRENHTAGLGERIKLDWGDMIDESAGSEYSRVTSKPFIQDGKLAFLTFGDSGDYVAMAFDMDSGDCDMMEVKNLADMAPYKDGKALIQTNDTTSNPAKYAFSTLDLNTGEVVKLIERDMPDLICPTNILYDDKTDNLYYRKSGELWVARGVDIDGARSVSVASGFGSFSSQMALTNDGCILAPDIETIVKYNADPDARARTVLRVIDWGMLTEQSAFAFNERHPDVEVVRDPKRDGIIEAMMNRSAEVDVYGVEMKSADFAALYNRGFMADISSSAEATKLAGEMYPAIAQAVTKDGKLVALPITMFSITFGYSPDAFEAIGLTKDDVPKTWTDFFALLKGLPDVVDDYEHISVFDKGSTALTTKKTMVEQVLSSWLMYLSSDAGEGAQFDSPALREVFAGLDQLDFDQLCANATHDAYDSVAHAGDVTYATAGAMAFGPSGGGQREMALFTTFKMLNASVPFDEYDPKPLILAISNDTPPIILSEVSVMFVNPFSNNIPLAIDFVDCAARNLDKLLYVEICPDRNEPIISGYAESDIAERKASIEGLQSALKKADDEDAALIIESNLKFAVEDLERYETTGKYFASAESIAEYREYAPYIRPGAGYGADVKNAPEIADTIRQYADGAMNADQLIRNIDQKLRMMKLEGM